MSPTPINYVAFTAPINPPSVAPLTPAQIWRALQLKIRRAEVFVGAAITSTSVLSTSTDPLGRVVVEREVVFKEGNRLVKEICTEYPGMKVEFAQPETGSRVMNIVSEADQGWCMTYTFEWVHEGMGEKELEERKEGERRGAKMAVEETIKAMRGLAEKGEI